MTLDDALTLHKNNGTACVHNLAGWTTILEDGKAIAYSERACYAGMSYEYAAEKLRSKPVLVVNALRKTHISKTWLTWLIKDSPFAQTYASVDVAKAIDNWATIHTTKTPANLLVGAMQAERMMWEHPRMIKSFEYLVENAPDVDKNFLFLLAIYLNCDNKMFSTGYPFSHTWWVYGDASNKLCHNFLTSKFIFFTKEYKINQNYNGIHKLWAPSVGSKYTISFYTWLMENLSTIVNKKEVESKNPFQAAKTKPTNSYYIEADKLNDVCQTLYTKFMKEMEDA